MRNVHVYASDLAVADIDDQDLSRSLYEPDRLEACAIFPEHRHTDRQAAGARRVAKLPGEHEIVRFSQEVDDPGPQVRIAQVGQGQRPFDDIANVVQETRYVWTRLVIGDGSKAARRRKIFGIYGICENPGKFSERFGTRLCAKATLYVALAQSSTATRPIDHKPGIPLLL